MPLVIPAPDSDCNAPCQADATELCGSGNRLAVYQDTGVSPPSFQTCLPNARIVGNSGFRFHMQALPLGGSVGPLTNPVLIGTLELAAQAGAPSFFLLSVSLIFTSLFLDVGLCVNMHNRLLELQRRTWNTHSLVRGLSLTALMAKEVLLLFLPSLGAHRYFHYLVPFQGLFRTTVIVQWCVCLDTEPRSNNVYPEFTSQTPLDCLVHLSDHQPSPSMGTPTNGRCVVITRAGALMWYSHQCPLRGITTSRVARMWFFRCRSSSEVIHCDR